MALHLEKCPVCKAKRAHDGSEEPICRRCGADLEPVIRCYKQARALLDACRRLLSSGHALEALRVATRARFLLDAPETRQTLAAALLANRRISAALIAARGSRRAIW